MPTTKAILMASVAMLGLATSAYADDDRGRPQAQRAQHVLLLSVDGMHEVDLRLWIANHPTGTLAALAKRGTVYKNAYTTAPSDSFPGMLAQATGGTSKSTGVFYDDSYERTFFAPNSGCVGTPGAETQYAENIDYNQKDITAGGTLGKPLTQIDPANLPQRLVNGVCTVVYPHQFIQTNTMFEVLKAHGLHTAWSDKHPAYEIMNGPSGQGIEDLYTPEINSQIPGDPKAEDNTTSFSAVRNYDQIKVTAIIHEIDGKDSTGHVVNGYTPAIFGMNFQAVSVGQKLAKAGYQDDTSYIGGYLDAAGTPGNALTRQLQFIDDSVGSMVRELKLQNLYDNTVVIISAKHGQSPIDRTLRRAIPDTYAAIASNGPNFFDVADDVALIWLDPATRTPAVYAQTLAKLKAAKAALGIDYIVTREELAEIYRDPFADTRTPDFFVVPNKGVIYTGGSKLAEHGGVADDDRHVAMLVSAAGLNGNTVGQTVFTTQIAPTILSTLRVSPYELQAVRREGTEVLPGLNGRQHDE